MDRSLSDRLDRLIEAADGDPTGTLATVDELLDDSADPLTCARCWHARGLAHRALGDLEAARSSLSEGIACREGVEHDDVAAMIQLTRASVMLMLGDVEACRSDLDEAIGSLSSEHELDGIVQSAAVEHRLGNLAAAAGHYQRALQLAAESDRRRESARIHSNLGLLLTETGDYEVAADHLTSAIELYDAVGVRDGAWFAEHNLGYLRLLEGDLVVALRHFDTANTVAISAGAPPVANVDKSAALLAAGLARDALEAAMEAVRALAHADVTEQADALTSAARAALAASEPDAAQTLADRALEVSASLSRVGWRASVRAIRLEAQTETGSISAGDALDGWARIHRELVELELDPLIHNVIVAAARCAVRVGSDADVETWMARLSDREPVSNADRSERHHALALGHDRLGHRDDALREAAAAVDDARRSARWLGTVDLRLGTGTRLGRSARLAARLAHEQGDVDATVGWVDAALTACLDLPGLRPPGDPALRAVRAELRSARDALAQDLAEGDDPETRRRAVDRVQRAEAAAADQLRLTGADDGDPAEPDHRAESDSLRRRLPAGRSAVWFAVVDSAALRFQMTCDEVTAVDLGSADDLRASIDRAHRRTRTDIRKGTFSELAREQLATLDDALLGGLDEGGGELVVCLDPELGPAPLEALPSLAATGFVTAPSLSTHLRCAAIPAAPIDDVLAVAGPGLARATTEADSIGARFGHSTVLTGPAATVEAVMGGLGASVLHLACHGRARSDHPMFSAFELADGPLTLHDLQLVKPTPRLVTAGACELQRGGPDPTRAPHNIDISLLSMGTRTVISSNQLVPDGATADLMVELYRRMTAGASAARALASLRTDPQHHVIAAAFRITGADIGLA